MFYYLNILSKIASRKNLYNYICNSFKNLTESKSNKSIKVLNIGSGGQIAIIIKKYFNEIYSIDIDKRRDPDQVIDICDKNFVKKIKFKPNLVCMFEVLEHTSNPHKAIDNVYKVLKKGDLFLFSVPFNFHIHDEPNDFFRFTEHGLKLLLERFSSIKIQARNGWLESIFVNFIRLEKENNILSKILGKLFIIFYFLFYPLIQIIQNIITSKKLTTGYFVQAIK
jgi:SAM-dependent methyltransferase